ncbi:hypothetical protein PG996_013875 [Apiospora saccharicola]|uniref:Rrn9 domain-containing protein n=1 Tax=Apiospora saccharicola TaxID=335842 RepID=A0ABR1TGQ0_9PEZI
MSESLRALNGPDNLGERLPPEQGNATPSSHQYRLAPKADMGGEKIISGSKARHLRSTERSAAEAVVSLPTSNDKSLPEDGFSLRRVKPQLLQTALAEFVSWTQHANVTSRGQAEDTGNHAGGTPHGQGRIGQSSKSLGKRPQRFEDGTSNNSDDRERGPEDNKKRKLTGPEDDDEKAPTLACPFYKKNPAGHSKCLSFRLKRIRDVKQHLNRKHLQPHHGSACGTHFETQQLARGHERARVCDVLDFSGPDGISEDQRERLSDRVDRKNSMTEQWYTVWEIVFPGCQRPPSPFVESPMHEAFSALREFWNERREALIAEHLQSDELPYSIPSEERHMALLHSATLRQLMSVILEHMEQRYLGLPSNSDSEQLGASDNPLQGVQTSQESVTVNSSSSRQHLRSAPPMEVPQSGSSSDHVGETFTDQAEETTNFGMLHSASIPSSTTRADTGQTSEVMIENLLGEADMGWFDSWMDSLGCPIMHGKGTEQSHGNAGIPWERWEDQAE